jgi:hypothetical protein
MSKRQRRLRADRLTDDQVQVLVARTRADIDTILDQVLDDEAGLARIYAMHGQQLPQQPATGRPDGDVGEDDGQIQIVCDRIAMLESALAHAARRDRPSGHAQMYLRTAGRFLVELRFGLTGRDLSAQDAFRLLANVRHDLREADHAARAEQRLPLPQPVLAGIADLRELIADLTTQAVGLDREVARLFGHSGERSAIPVPQH